MAGLGSCAARADGGSMGRCDHKRGIATHERNRGSADLRQGSGGSPGYAHASGGQHTSVNQSASVCGAVTACIPRTTATTAEEVAAGSWCRHDLGGQRRTGSGGSAPPAKPHREPVLQLPPLNYACVSRTVPSSGRRAWQDCILATGTAAFRRGSGYVEGRTLASIPTSAPSSRRSAPAIPEGQSPPSPKGNACRPPR